MSFQLSTPVVSDTSDRVYIHDDMVTRHRARYTEVDTVLTHMPAAITVLINSYASDPAPGVMDLAQIFKDVRIGEIKDGDILAIIDFGYKICRVVKVCKKVLKLRLLDYIGKDYQQKYICYDSGMSQSESTKHIKKEALYTSGLAVLQPSITTFYMPRCSLNSEHLQMVRPHHQLWHYVTDDDEVREFRGSFVVTSGFKM